MTPVSRGLFLMVIGIAFMSAMDGIIKHLSGTIEAPQVLFLRASFGLIPILIIAKMRGGLKGIKTKRPIMHGIRGILGSTAFIAFTLGLRDMSLANGLAVVFAAPFFMIVFSAILIGEKIGAHRIGAMIVGFAGVIIVLQPDAGILGTGAPYMLVCAAGYALTQVMTRKYADTESAVSLSFWVTSSMALTGLVLSFFFWKPLSVEIILWGVGMGLTGGIAHYLMTEAARIAPPAVVSPMEYTALIWAAIMDWMIWQIYPEQALMMGSTVIIASGIYILWRERLHKIKEPIHEYP